MRLIDADNLVKDVHEEWDPVCIWDETGDATACEIERLIDAQPTVDPWHYPSKGEYPTDGEQVFVAWTSEGSYDVVKFRHCLWGMKLSPPYAWQNIIAPKEEA